MTKIIITLSLIFNCFFAIGQSFTSTKLDTIVTDTSNGGASQWNVWKTDIKGDAEIIEKIVLFDHCLNGDFKEVYSPLNIYYIDISTLTLFTEIGNTYHVFTKEGYLIAWLRTRLESDMILAHKLKSLKRIK
jgi:hypothetical protein